MHFSVFFPLTWLTDSGVVRPVNPATPLVLRMLKGSVDNGFPSKTLRSCSPGLPLMAGSFIPAHTHRPPSPKAPHSPLVVDGVSGDPFQGLSTSSASGGWGWVGDLLPGSDFEVCLNP